MVSEAASGAQQLESVEAEAVGALSVVGVLREAGRPSGEPGVVAGQPQRLKAVGPFV